MSRILNWSEDELSSYYEDREIDLSWINKSSRHQFRWKSLKGPWITSDRRISSSKKLIELFSKSMPTDVYVSTSSWLDPINLPRIKDTKRPSPILLDHLVVFDIDIRPFCLIRLEEARKATLNLRNWLIDNTVFQYIVDIYKKEDVLLTWGNWLPKDTSGNQKKREDLFDIK